MLRISGVMKVFVLPVFDLALILGCRQSPPPPTEVVVATPKKVEIDILKKPQKDIVGYMDIPWGVSIDQVVNIISPKREWGSYSSGASRDRYTLEIPVSPVGLGDIGEFTFSPDKQHLKEVLVSTNENIKKAERQKACKICLSELTDKFGSPTSVSRYKFFAGEFVIRHWKLPSTRIDFGEFIALESAETYTKSDFLILYLPSKAKRVRDLRNRLFPYSDRISGEPDWKLPD